MCLSFETPLEISSDMQINVFPADSLDFPKKPETWRECILNLKLVNKKELDGKVEES